MSDRSDSWITSLALGAAGLVLAAPVLGRSGYVSAANIALVLATGCGLTSFLLAGHATLRAARSPARSVRDAGETR